MTSPYLISDLKRDEGCRLEAYADPLSGGDPWTIGYGSTGPGIGPGAVWTQAQADDELAKRVGGLISKLQAALPWFVALGEERQSALVNMAYNVGLEGLLAFHHTLSFIEQRLYDQAAAGMLNSLWARQVGARADRLAKQMATNVHQG